MLERAYAKAYFNLREDYTAKDYDELRALALKTLLESSFIGIPTEESSRFVEFTFKKNEELSHNPVLIFEAVATWFQSSEWSK